MSKYSVSNSEPQQRSARNANKESRGEVDEEEFADSLKRKFQKIKRELKNQREVCLEMINSEERVLSRDEVQKLDETYRNLADTAFRLREQLPSLEADEIKAEVDIEDEEVFAVKKQMINKNKGKPSSKLGRKHKTYYPGRR